MKLGSSRGPGFVLAAIKQLNLPLIVGSTVIAPADLSTDTATVVRVIT